MKIYLVRTSGDVISRIRGLLLALLLVIGKQWHEAGLLNPCIPF